MLGQVLADNCLRIAPLFGDLWFCHVERVEHRTDHRLCLVRPTHHERRHDARAKPLENNPAVAPYLKRNLVVVARDSALKVTLACVNESLLSTLV